MSGQIRNVIVILIEKYNISVACVNEVPIHAWTTPRRQVDLIFKS